MGLKLVPFQNAWLKMTALDLRAIYRRPRYTTDEYDQKVQCRDEFGNPLWDLTAPLRVIDHANHIAKGFEYVTLASRLDLAKAGQAGTLGPDWKQYDQHQIGGPWHWKMYLDSAEASDNAASKALAADVEQFGAEAVEAIRKRTDPGFSLPDSLKGKGKKSTKVPA